MSDYKEYLNSDTWKTIRAQRMAIDKNECCLCGEKAAHVHHKRYPKKLGTETVNDLASLCEKCHSKHHGKGSKTAAELADSVCSEVLSHVMDLSFLYDAAKVMLEENKNATEEDLINSFESDGYTYVNELEIVKAVGSIIVAIKAIASEQIEAELIDHWCRYHYEEEKAKQAQNGGNEA